MGDINTYKEYIDRIIDKTNVIEELDCYKDYVFDFIHRWLSIELMLEHIDSDIREALKNYTKERIFY